LIVTSNGIARSATAARMTARTLLYDRRQGIASAQAICPSKPSVFALSR